MNILQINTADMGGGAEGSARNLFRAYRDLGHRSWLSVGQKLSNDPDVFEIPRIPPVSLFGRMIYGLSSHIKRHGNVLPKARGICRRLDILASRDRRRAYTRGLDNLSFEGTGRLLDALPGKPDVIHCHNLHGWYFDLQALAHFAPKYPIILNLRDAWLLTGHCGYFIDCERWRTGCGNCPDLRRYPGVLQDATRENWVAKRDLFKKCDVYVTAPSTWLLECARDSMLDAREYRLIPNGIDLDTFRPGDRTEARRRLGLRETGDIVLFAAASPQNVYKDPETMVAGVRRMLAQNTGKDLTFVCLGRRPPVELLRNPAIIHVPFQSDPACVADYYRASDVFIHTARAEAFGKTTTEAMACGTPVVATAVGGLTDQVIDGDTGYLCAPEDPEALSDRTLMLLGDAETRTQMGRRAAQRGTEFGLERQVDAFLTFYAEVIERHRSNAPALTTPST